MIELNIQGVQNEKIIPALMADHQGLITYVNAPFEVAFGWKRQEIMGKPISALMPPSHHDSHHLGFSRFLLTGKPTILNQPLNLKAITKDGREFDSEHIICAEEREGKWIFGATIRPL